MNDDVHLKGSSVPLASSNIGQSGLRHGLNTNTMYDRCIPYLSP